MAGYSVTYTVVDNATKQIDAINRRVAQMRAPMERMSRSVSRFVDVSGLRKVATGFEWIAKSVGTVFRSLSAVVPLMGAITGAASIAGMVKLVASYADWAHTLVQTADNIGITTQQLQQFQDATRLAGGNASDMTESLKSLHDKMADMNIGRGGATETAQMLQRLGVNAYDANHHLRSMGDLMPEVIAKIAALKDPADRAVIATGLLGAEGDKLVETFRQSHQSFAQWFTDAGRYKELTDDQKRSLQQFTEAQGRVGVAFDHLGQQISVMVAQHFGPLLEKFAIFVEKHTPDILRVLDQISTRFARWLDGIKWEDIEAGLKTLKDNLDTIKLVVEGIALVFATSWAVGIVANIATVIAALAPLAAALAPITAALALLAAGGVAGAMEAPMVDEYGRVIGNWGGREPKSGTPPPPVQKQSSGGGYLPGGATHASFSQPGVTALGAPGGGGPLAPVRDQGGSIGERNRNPLNLTALPGQASEGRFRTFASWDEGVAAAVKQLQINTEQHNKQTLRQQIERWAPPNENNTAGYVDRVAKEAGIDPDKPLNTRDPETLRRVVTAMSHVELGRAVPATAIDRGVAMATGTAPPVAVAQGKPPNGAVDVSITHKNPPPNSAVTATGSGSVNVAPVRVEHQDMASI